MSGGDEARRRINEIKFRNLGGNMEGIAGFNLTYNDEPAEAVPTPVPKYVPPPPRPTGEVEHFQYTAERLAKRRAGKLPHDQVIQRARADSDKRALRASDGAVLRVPYVVRLKSAGNASPPY